MINTHDSCPLERMFFSSRFSVVSSFVRGLSSDDQAALEALSDCIDLASNEIEIQLLREIAGIMRRRDVFSHQESFHRIADRLLQGEQISVVFVNDNGVYAGAGIGVKRQAQSFALAGHKVTVIALNNHDPGVKKCGQEFQQWCSASDLQVELQIASKHESINTSDQQTFSEYVLGVIASQPTETLVVFGNLHSCEISPSLITRIMAAGYPCILYAHDLDWISGGCAYPQYYECQNFQTGEGCRDQNCLMPANTYPTSSWGRKTANYGFREVIISTGLLPVFTNSDWTSSFFTERFKPLSRIYTALLGTDTKIYQPSAENRRRLRTLHSIPEDALVIAIGADNNSRLGKGGEEVNQITKQMSGRENIIFLSFGHAGLDGTNIINTGYQETELGMAEVFQCADLFLNMATIDCFGQVSIEAAACGCIPMVLKGTGTSEAVVHMKNGILVSDRYDAIRTLDRLNVNRETLDALSVSTVRHTAQYFSLESQYIRWVTTLLLDKSHHKPSPGQS